MNQPKRHHYIPVVILKRFADEDGRLWLCRREGGVPIIWKSRPEKAFLERNLYTKQDSSRKRDISVEEDLGKVESAASPVVDEIVSHSLAGRCPCLATGERETLIRFIDHHHRRTPENHPLVDKDMENWEAYLRTDFERESGRPPTKEELAEMENPELRKTARQSMVANLAGLPMRNDVLQLYVQCPIRFGVIRVKNKSFVIGSRIEPGDWFPVHKRVAFRLVAENGPDTLTEIRDMAEIRRINEQTARDSLAFGGSSEQLVRSLARAHPARGGV
ncbi:MAG: DUF4238 domain-containing protein [Albidovulum sp.]|nr:DUF4238 domain-containing protein [Albidovulum sp.]